MDYSAYSLDLASCEKNEHFVYMKNKTRNNKVIEGPIKEIYVIMFGAMKEALNVIFFKKDERVSASERKR